MTLQRYWYPLKKTKKNIHTEFFLEKSFLGIEGSLSLTESLSAFKQLHFQISLLQNDILEKLWEYLTDLTAQQFHITPIQEWTKFMMNVNAAFVAFSSAFLVKFDPKILKLQMPAWKLQISF